MKTAFTSFIVLLCISTVQAQAQSREPRKTVLDGVYSDPQATRGHALYMAICGACHGNALEGLSAPQITGDFFLERWREDTLDTFYNYIRQSMPRGRPRDAQPIADADYLDIFTYILKVNGYPAGSSELTPDLLGSVMLVGKNGPGPVPDGSLVVSVGCLSQIRDDLWGLLRATEPVRTRTPTTTTQAELSASSQKSLGPLTFRLADLEAVPGFTVDAHKGHKVLAKGYLVRQPNAERISLTAIEMVDSNCS